MGNKFRLLVASMALVIGAPLFDSHVWLFAWQNRVAQNEQQVRTSTEKDNADLALEIKKLTKELHELSINQRRLLDVLLLQTEQGRVEKLDDRLFTINTQLRTILTRETNLEYRVQHIDSELAARNIINRVEGERLVRNELEGELTQVRAERERLEEERSRITKALEEINGRLDSVRNRVSFEGYTQLLNNDAEDRLLEEQKAIEKQNKGKVPAVNPLDNPIDKPEEPEDLQ